MNRKGTNQYQIKWGLRADTWASIWFIAFVVTVGIWMLQPTIISPLSDSQNIVYATEGKSELQQIVDYIIHKWEKHGRTETVKALSCFISESGLRPEAYNFNKNGTWDYGIAQWNQVHGQTIEELRGDWKKQIDLAYRLYTQRGWKPWYGAGCSK